MSVYFFLVVLFVMKLRAFKAPLISAGIKFAEGVHGFISFDILIFDELRVVEGDQGEHFKEVFLPVYLVHVLGGNSVFLSFAVADDPNAWRRKNSHLCSYFWEQLAVDVDCPFVVCSNRIVLSIFAFGLLSCLVSEYVIVILRGTLSFFFFLGWVEMLIISLFPLSYILSFKFIAFINLTNETHVDEFVHFLLLILWPYAEGLWWRLFLWNFFRTCLFKFWRCIQLLLAFLLLLFLSFSFVVVFQELFFVSFQKFYFLGREIIKLFSNFVNNGLVDLSAFHIHVDVRVWIPVRLIWTLMLFLTLVMGAPVLNESPCVENQIIV